jgi:multicomponent Na+:H+ antiporter subunit F
MNFGANGAGDVVIGILWGILGLSTLAAVWRTAIGPTILDRVASSDVVVVNIILALGLYVAQTRSPLAMALILAMTMLAFLGNIAVTRFVTREPAKPSDNESRRRPRRRDRTPPAPAEEGGTRG